jgi:uncharacterized membrane protein YcgQ (UPF0703/DUF1980 family)
MSKIAFVIIAVEVLFYAVGCDKTKQEATSQENPAPVASITFETTKEPNFIEKKETVDDPNLVEIKERMFIAQVNNVYLNYKDYLEKTIKLEGLFKKEQAGTGSEPYCYVLRYGPGCCGDDGNVGFEVAWEKDREKPYPDIDSWVEATGVLKMEERNTYKYLYLELASLTALDKRGIEKVNR